MTSSEVNILLKVFERTLKEHIFSKEDLYIKGFFKLSRKLVKKKRVKSKIDGSFREIPERKVLKCNFSTTFKDFVNE